MYQIQAGTGVELKLVPTAAAGAFPLREGTARSACPEPNSPCYRPAGTETPYENEECLAHEFRPVPPLACCSVGQSPGLARVA